MSVLDKPSKRKRCSVFDPKSTDKMRKSQAQEARTAKAINGQRTPGSGAFAGHKGDVISDDFLVECKMTVKKSISLKSAWLAKIYREAVEKGKYPALHITVEESGQDWIAVPLTVFESLLDKN